ncbi:hypothetical protein KAT36_00560 [Candidatus Pacearchaeota archaeon]|nr:hypothetical protein [Candidatus Pacearchaeota archaeon]
MEPKQSDFEAEYNSLKQDHNLPEFEAMAQDFDIEKLYEKETSFLAREIRRAINEKITAYISLFETLINPSSPPMFVFKILKNISPKEKESIQEFYKILSKTQIEIMKLDTVYSEESEVKFIKETFNIWQEVKTKIYTLFESFETNFKDDDISKGRSYFD